MQVSEVTSRYDVDNAFMGSEVKYGTIIDSWWIFPNFRIKYWNSLLCSISGLADTFTLYFTAFCRFCTAKRKRIYKLNPLKWKHSSTVWSVSVRLRTWFYLEPAKWQISHLRLFPLCRLCIVFCFLQISTLIPSGL